MQHGSLKKRPIQRKIDGLWPKQNSPSGTISFYKLGKGKQKKKMESTVFP